MSEQSPQVASLSEMDRLRLQLSKEKAQRVTAEMNHLQMVQQQLQREFAQVSAENKVLFDSLKVTYSLQPHDEIGEDGVIKRAAIRALKEG